MAELPPALDVLLEQFGSAAYNFLDASVGVWTEDEVLSKWHGEWAQANTDPLSSKAFAQNVLDKYMSDFQQYQTRILNKDETLFLEESEFFVKVGAKEKWSTASDQVKDTVWQYLKQIVQSASVSDVYSKCPPKIMNIVTSMASTIVGDVQNGTFDPSQINPMAISQKLMGSLKEEDIKEWGNSLMSDGGMDGLLTMMSSAMGGGVDLGAIASAAQNMGNGSGGGFPNIDPSLLSSMLGNLGGGAAMPDISSLLQNFKAAGPKPKKK
jgi:hypothetical protein